MSHMTRSEYKRYILNKEYPTGKGLFIQNSPNKPQQGHTAKVKPKMDNHTTKDKISLETLLSSLRSMFGLRSK